MVYLDEIYKLIHDANLNENDGITLKMFTDSLAWNKQQTLPAIIPLVCQPIIKQIEEKGLLNKLNDILARPIEFENRDLDDNVARIN